MTKKEICPFADYLINSRMCSPKVGCSKHGVCTINKDSQCKDHYCEALDAAADQLENLPNTPPTATAKAASVASDFGSWLASGCPMRSAGERERIKAICHGCPKYKDNSCTLCGCRLSTKISWATTDCPIGKWDADKNVKGEYRKASPSRIVDLDLVGPPPGRVTCNCSIFNFRGRRVFAYRHGWGGADVYLGDINEEYKVTNARRLAIPQNDWNAGGREDPRLFEYQGRLYCMYIGVQMRGSGRRIFRTNVCAVGLDDDWNVVSNWQTGFDRRAGWEKNWQFFEHGGKLYAIYKIHPHTVFEVDPETGWSKKVYETKYPNHWTHGALRGGASPVYHNGVFYSFFHGYLHSRHDKGTYTAGCYTFEAKPPFRVLKMTPEPIHVPDPSERPGPSTPYVVYPCGAVHENGKWVISYGHMDQSCRIAEFDEGAVERAMIPILE